MQQYQPCSLLSLIIHCVKRRSNFKFLCFTSGVAGEVGDFRLSYGSAFLTMLNDIANTSQMVSLLEKHYCGNDMIFWIFPVVPCHAFCM